MFELHSVDPIVVARKLTKSTNLMRRHWEAVKCRGNIRESWSPPGLVKIKFDTSNLASVCRDEITVKSVA